MMTTTSQSPTPRIINITATTISDAWFQAVYETVHHGREVPIDKGSFENEQTRLETDFISILIASPWADPMLPVFPESSGIPNPYSEAAAEKYLEYIFSPHIKEGEQYTYGKRIFGGLHAPFGYSSDESQIAMIIRSLTAGKLQSNHHVIQISQRDDILLEHPPCLRHIQIKVIDGAICFYPYFRSWDLWSAFATNLYGIENLKQYMCYETGLKNGFILASCPSLHLYSTMIGFAKERIGEK